MCGIAGKISKNKIDVSEIKMMTELMISRGPDAEGQLITNSKTESIGLGQRRLKIIDLSDTANQPFIDDETGNILVFNGEIYNYQDIKKQFLADVKFKTASDTEVILKLYARFGLQGTLDKLRGMFAIALWDKKDEKMVLARDRLGKKPLYYFQNSECFIFASNIKPILANKEVKKIINFNIIDTYLTYNYNPDLATAYENIYKLAPAEYLIYEHGKVSKNKYWQLDFRQKLELKESEIITKTEEIITEAVRLRMISDVPLGAFLSGGVDSSLIVALMSKQSNKVKTFSIGFEQADFNELKYARLVADQYKTEHQEFIVQPNALDILDELVDSFEEPYADPSQIPMYYLAKLTRKYVTVALNGDGGDECFGGYERYLGMKYVQYYKTLPVFIRQKLDAVLKNIPENTAHLSLTRRLKWLNSVSLKEQAEAYTRANTSFTNDEKAALYNQEFTRKTKHNLPENLLCEAYNSAHAVTSLDRMLYTDITKYLPEDLLIKADRMTMAHSLEARSPLLDQELIEFSAKVQDKYKLKGNTLKYILKKLAEKYLPSEIIYRQKQGFGVPLGSWFRNELKVYLQDSFKNSSLVKANILEHDSVQKLIGEHLTGKKNLGRKLFTLLMLEKWYKKNCK